MREVLAEHQGVQLSLQDYQAEFRQMFWEIDQFGFYKLERQQTFEEPGDDSWEAWVAGESELSLKLLDQRIPEMVAHAEALAEAGFRSKRARVVTEPLSDYLHWELQLLRRRAAHGRHDVRIVFPSSIFQYEQHGELPELVVLGDRVMYEVLYDGHGVLCGGVRYTNLNLINYCRTRISWLHAMGIPIEVFMRNRGL